MNSVRRLLLFLGLSATAVLPLLGQAPTISSTPQSQTLLAGQAATFSVTATGAQPLSFQWYRNGLPISGATSATLQLPNIAVGDRGFYWVEVSNAAGRAVSGDWAALAAGYRHTLFLKKDGTLWAAGSNQYGQLGDSTTIDRYTPVQVATNVIAVAGGLEHSLFITRDGTLWAMGQNVDGELGDGTTTSRATPVAITTNVRAASAGYRHSLFLKSDGTLWAMGANSVRQLGDGTTTARRTPIQVATGVASISAGGTHSLFVKTDGTLWGMGDNSNGRLGPAVSQASGPVQIASGVRTASGGYNHSIFVKTDDTVWSVGSAGVTQLASGVALAAAGDLRNVYLQNDGKVWNTYLNRYESSSAGNADTDQGQGFFVTLDGALWAWGQNTTGQLGDGTTVARSSPVQIADNVAVPAQLMVYAPIVISADPESALLATGTTRTLRVSYSGDVTGIQWLKDGVEILGATAASYVVNASDLQAAGRYTARLTNPLQTVLSADAVISVMNPPRILTPPVSQVCVAGETVTFGVSADGGGELVYQWLFNGQPIPGATGATYRIESASAGSVGAYSVEVANAADRTVSFTAPAIATFATHSIVLRSDGTLWATGTNAYGQHADGTLTARTAFAKVAAGVKAVSVGENFTVFIKMDNSLWGVGRNHLGQLGDGTTVDRTTPVLIASGVRQVSAGTAHTFFVKLDGTLWATGRNDRGQLADGTLINRSAPVQVDAGVKSVSCGDRHTVYVKTNGTAWATGANDLGQFGDGTNSSAVYPLQIGEFVESVAAGIDTTFVIDKWSALWACGNNDYGQLGNGNTQRQYLPVLVSTDAKSVWGGSAHTVFLKTDGSLWGMGQNTNGALGDGTTASRSSPGLITSGAITAGAGAGATFVLRNSGEVVACGANDGGRLGLGTTTPRLTLSTALARVLSGQAATLSVETATALAFANWRSGQFSVAQLADSSVSGPLADPDRDGLPNIVEFMLGSDALVASPVVAPRLALVNGVWEFTYSRPALRLNLSVRVETSTDLVNWTVNGLTHERVQGGANEQWRATLPHDGTRRYFRLGVVESSP